MARQVLVASLWLKELKCLNVELEHLQLTNMLEVAKKNISHWYSCMQKVDLNLATWWDRF